MTDPLMLLIQRLNSNPYSLTKSECIEEAERLRAALAAPAAQEQQAEPVDGPRGPLMVPMPTHAAPWVVSYAASPAVPSVPHPARVAAFGALSRALGQPDPVEALPGEAVEDALARMAADRLTAVPSVSQWQPIETAPKDAHRGLIDVWTATGRRLTVYWDAICGEWRHLDYTGGLYAIKNATHWMPLPPAPGATPQPAQAEPADVIQRAVRRLKDRLHGDPAFANSLPPDSTHDEVRAMPAGKEQAAPAGLTPLERPTREDLIAALAFYADGGHFSLSDGDAWDTVSGEPPNWWCDEAGTATVEDGSIAKMTLAGELTFVQIEAMEDGEEFGARAEAAATTGGAV